MNIGNVSILIVEVDILHAEGLKSKLMNSGFQKVEIRYSFDEASRYLEDHSPNLILMDFRLDGKFKGIDLFDEYQQLTNTPVIFFSSEYGQDVLDAIKPFGPFDFFPKEVSDFELLKSVELALVNFEQTHAQNIFEDFFFVKSGREIKKLSVEDIDYITIDKKYAEIIVGDRKYYIRSSLADFQRRLPSFFVKVHKAYIVNIKKVKAISTDDNFIRVGEAEVPFSRLHKKELLNMYYIP